MGASAGRRSAAPAARPRRPALKALVFDVDGTLAETERDGHRVAFNQAFRDAGFDWDWDHVLYGKLLRVAGGKERLRHYLRHYRPCGGPRRDVEPFVEAMHRAKARAYAALVASGALRLRPGVERLLREASAAGLALALATSSSRESVDALLRHALGPDAAALFRVIGTGEAVPEKKPSPELHRWVLRRLRCAPESAVAFEDARVGLLAAAGAGIPTIVTPSWYADRERFTEAKLVLSGLGEPGQPFRVLRGDAAGHTFVGVDALRAWHAGWALA